MLLFGMFGRRGMIGCFVVGIEITVRFGAWLDFTCAFGLHCNYSVGNILISWTPFL